MTRTVKIKTIKYFQGPYAWLGNNYLSPIWYGGIGFPSMAHAFLATKTYDYPTRDKIAEAPLDKLEELSYSFPVRINWNGLTSMKDLLEIKFGINTYVAGFAVPEQMMFFKKLAITGNVSLVYGNKDHDNFWGTCFCGEDGCKDVTSKNWLGFTLEAVRNQIHNRLDMITKPKNECYCGNVSTKRILYSTGKIPRVILVCDDSDCTSSAVKIAQNESSDGLIYDYDPENLTSQSYMSKEVKEIVKKQSTDDPDTMTDEELMDYYGYSESGVWMGHMGMMRNITGNSSSISTERKWETKVIKC